MIYQLVKETTEILPLSTSHIAHLCNKSNLAFVLLISKLVLKALTFIIIDRGGVRDTTIEAKAKDAKKKSKVKVNADFLRTDPLEANDRNGRGQGPRTQFFWSMIGKFSMIIKRESA